MRPPEEKGHWIWGSTAEFQKAPYRFPAEVAEKHGGIARFRLMHRRLIAVSDPGYYEHILVKNHLSYARGVHFRNQQMLIGRGLLTTNGQEWLKKRTRSIPAFNREALQKLVPLSVKTAADFFSRWDKAAVEEKSISLIPETQKLTISIICQTLFSVDIDMDRAEKFCDDIRQSTYVIRKKNTSIFPLPLWFPNKNNAELIANRNDLDEFVLDKIAQRSKLTTRNSDILNIFLGERIWEDLSKDEQSDILAECKTMLLAGFETTAITLTWALYLLASHPEVAKKLQMECESVLSGKDPDWSHLDKLHYTRQVINETMRLYPIVFTQPRECVKDDRLGPYEIKKGDILLLSIYSLHRSPQHWESPDEFRPERFAEGSNFPKHCFAPFGKGKHTCIGNNFAVYEVMVVLSMIAIRYNLSRADSNKIGMKSTLVLIPDQDIFIRLERR